MWALVSVKNPDKSLRLLVGQVYSLGRLNCDIVEPADKSISRKHAEFEVSHVEGNLSYPHKPPILTIKDLSKFGTAVQNQKLNGASKMLNNGDVVKFGTMETVYRAVYEPMVVTTSCLDNPAKKQLKTLICELGGHVISEWRKECSLLVMSNISVTVKVICALIQQKPIVMVKYISDLISSIRAGAKSPDPEEYAPPLTESLVNPREVSFKKNPARATLFDGKTFLFISTKQFKRLNVVVELAGGKPKLIEEGTDDDDDSILVALETVVMQFDIDDATQNLSQNAVDWARHVQDVLKTHGKRMIADSELGYAILYCSTSRYCNPNSSAGSLAVGAALPSQSLSARPDATASEMSERLPVPIKIKEEPMSQASGKLNEAETSRLPEAEVPERSPKSCPPSTSKRKRTGNDEETHVQPENKRAARVKKTPEKSPPPPARSRMKITRPDIHASESFTVQSERQESVKDEVDDLFDDMEAMASSRRATQRSRQNGTGAKKMKRTAKDEVKDEVDDLFDEFDDISSTRRRRRAIESQAMDENENQSKKRKRGRNDIDDETDHQKINQRERSMDIGSGDSPVTKRTQRDTSPETKSSPAPKRNRSPAPLKRSTSPAPRKSPRPKREPSPGPSVKPVTVKDEVPETEEDSIRGKHAVSTDGYVSKNTVTNAPKSEVDTSLPVGVIQQEFASLVIRKPGSQVKKSMQTLSNGSCVWNGKTMKNFKKFRKTPAPGSEGLPRIIGGSDLVPHNRSQRRDLDDWFEHAVEEETERDEMEKMAEKMFNYQPSKRTGRR